MQEGSFNDVNVSQIGFMADSTIFQSGEGQSATVDQTAFEGGELSSFIDQSDLTQTASVTQSGYGLVSSSIIQSGESNEATVLQDGSDLDSMINQSGTANIAFVDQQGEAKLSMIDQEGENHLADVAQTSDTAAVSMVMQSGMMNTAIVKQ